MLPLIKWAGGKRLAVKKIAPVFPSSYTRYLEPFIGGGALFWHHEKQHCYIADFSPELINFYQVVRDTPGELLDLVESYPNNADFYANLRSWDRKGDWGLRSPLDRASRFLYLNKTAYSGLWRISKDGYMNASYGKYPNIALPKREHMLAASKILTNTTIRFAHFREVVNEAKKGDFVYLDPPYLDTTFSAYTKEGFRLKDHEELREVCDKLDKKGVSFFMSNSYSDRVLSLWNGYEIREIESNRAIGAKFRPAKAKEVMVLNY